MRLALVGALIVAAALSPVRAAAQDGDEEAREQAHQMLLRSRGHYNAGRFVTAADILDEAYGVFPEPTLLFNAARAYEGAGRLDEAIDRYARFLETAEEIEDRGAIETRLATLREQRDRLAAADGDEPPEGSLPPPPPEPGGGGGVDPVPWTIAGIGALGVAAGAILGVLASDAYGQAEMEPEHRRATGLEQEAFDLSTGANIAFAVGGGVVAIGVIWGIISVATSGGDEQASRPGVIRF